MNAAYNKFGIAMTDAMIHFGWRRVVFAIFEGGDLCRFGAEAMLSIFKVNILSCAGISAISLEVNAELRRCRVSFWYLLNSAWSFCFIAEKRYPRGGEYSNARKPKRRDVGQLLEQN